MRALAARAFAFLSESLSRCFRCARAKPTPQPVSAARDPVRTAAASAIVQGVVVSARTLVTQQPGNAAAQRAWLAAAAETLRPFMDPRCAPVRWCDRIGRWCLELWYKCPAACLRCYYRRRHRRRGGVVDAPAPAAAAWIGGRELTVADVDSSGWCGAVSGVDTALHPHPLYVWAQVFGDRPFILNPPAVYRMESLLVPLLHLLLDTGAQDWLQRDDNRQQLLDFAAALPCGPYPVAYLQVTPPGKRVSGLVRVKHAMPWYTTQPQPRTLCQLLRYESLHASRSLISCVARRTTSLDGLCDPLPPPTAGRASAAGPELLAADDLLSLALLRGFHDTARVLLNRAPELVLTFRRRTPALAAVLNAAPLATQLLGGQLEAAHHALAQQIIERVRAAMLTLHAVHCAASGADACAAPTAPLTASAGSADSAGSARSGSGTTSTGPAAGAEAAARHRAWLMPEPVVQLIGAFLIGD